MTNKKIRIFFYELFKIKQIAIKTIKIESEEKTKVKGCSEKLEG
jgi:hypothetical protein